MPGFFILSICLLRMGCGQVFEAQSFSQTNASAKRLRSKSILSPVPYKPVYALANVFLATTPALSSHKATRRISSNVVSPRTAIDPEDAKKQEEPTDQGSRGNKNMRKERMKTEAQLRNRASKAVDLPTMLLVLNEVKALELDRQLACLAPVLDIVEKRIAEYQESGKFVEVLHVAEEIFQLAAKSKRVANCEPLITIMGRLYSRSGAPQRALCLIEEAILAGAKPKLRTFEPILARAAETGDRAMGEIVWRRLQTLQLEPQDSDFALMLRCMRGEHHEQLEILTQLLDQLPMPSDPTLVEELGRTFGVTGIAELFGTNATLAKGLKEEDGVWRVGWSSIDDTGYCSLSNRQLQSIDISPTEESELHEFIPRLASGSKSFDLFSRWLSSEEPFDAIIDGANVAFINQNYEGGHFRFDQIEAALQHFRSRGERALVVLHSKWLKTKTSSDLKCRKTKPVKRNQIPLNLTTTQPSFVSEQPSHDKKNISMTGGNDSNIVSTNIMGISPKHIPDDASIYPFPRFNTKRQMTPKSETDALVRSWIERDEIFIVPRRDYDDWYWLHAAFESSRRGKDKVQLVSNDLLRDHHWRMHGGKALLRWKERHMTRFSIWGERDKSRSNITFETLEPQPYSTRAQVAADGAAWHFPILAMPSRSEQLSSRGSRQVSKDEIDSAEIRWLVAYKTS